VVTNNDVAIDLPTEPWANYYDIFVRNAFGNFGDVLKEVSFSSMMAIMLTYENSRSMAYSVEENGARLYPDENFAREIMQLFTIGLWKLHRNGTQVLDANGDPISTYDNEDIMTFARSWTGFERNKPRANLESDWDTEYWASNFIDPMFLPAKDRRDVFPKLGLEDGGKRAYIGDKVQRCDDLPPRAFLQEGARYRFLGWDSTPVSGRADPEWWRHDNWQARLVLSEANSELFAALCNKADPSDPNGPCRFEPYVTLTETLNCVGSCAASSSGAWGECECSIDEPRVVRLEPSAVTGSSKPLYYEYVPAPCVEMAFPEDGNAQVVGETYGGNTGVMCADARLPVASTACCDGSGTVQTVCIFQGERVAYATAEARCQAAGMTTCNWDSVPGTNWNCGTDLAPWEWYNPKAGLQFTWTSVPCTVQAQVDKEGYVAVVHDATPLTNPVMGRVGLDTGTYFRVLWDGASFPKATDGCSGGSCYVRGTTCVCDTSVLTTSVFDGTFFPTEDELEDQLHIGAPKPGDGYSVCQAQVCIDAQSYVIVHTLTPITSSDQLPLAFGQDTIFETNSAGKSTYLFNKASIVQVGGGYQFRNAPMFNSPVDQTQQNALDETDAVLEHYLRNSNVAPFIATRLIQFLVTSNPSARYVQAVADAFTTGEYVSGSTFGSGEYGDLAATTAAIYLDPEARSSTLDADSAHGKARDPIMKVLHFLRAMELSSAQEREILATYWRDRIGQEAHNAPSVFGFYLQEFQPAGLVNDKGLVAPETQLFDAPKLVGYMNAISSLPMFGFSDCLWWAGLGSYHSRYTLLDHPEEGEFWCEQAADFDPATPTVPQHLGWLPVSWGGTSNTNDAPASAIVSEMDLLLTGGRLDTNSRSIIEQAYSAAASGGSGTDDLIALQTAQKLFAMTPEFHVTNRVQDSTIAPEVRNATTEELSENVTETTGYKAIVYLYLAGACDSYSALVPHSSCNPADLNQQYHDVRDDVAIDQASLLPISVPTGTQPCDVFGLHPSLSHVQQLYNSNEAAFIANIGPLVEPLSDKVDFEDKIKEVPPALFAHNTQTKVTQTVFAQDSTAGGVLGRIGDVLNAQASEAAGEDVEIYDGYSISGTPKILEGEAGVSRAADVLSGSGVAGLYYPAGDHEAQIRDLNANVAASIFGETYSEKVISTLDRIDTLGGALGTTATPYNGTCSDTYLDNQFRQVARIIAGRDTLEAKRDVFFVQHGGYDTHSDNGPALTNLLSEVDGALLCFTNELKAQGIWNNVTVVSASEFGRTLTSNGQGTDHAWGGNHFIAGGAVDGGKILGQFPSDLTDNGPLNIGRGRLIPTTAWEHLWHGLAQWFGVSSTRMPDILPNMGNFQNLFTEGDLFK